MFQSTNVTSKPKVAIKLYIISNEIQGIVVIIMSPGLEHFFGGKCVQFLLFCQAFKFIILMRVVKNAEYFYL